MNQRQITEFVLRLTGKEVRSTVVNGWVSMACPLAPWTHEKGGDKHPSFGVKIQPSGEVSIFNCYTCGRKGPLSYLAKEYGRLSGRDTSHLQGEASALETYGPQLPLWEEREVAIEAVAQPTLDEASYSDLFDPAYFRNRGRRYCFERGLSLATIQSCSIMYDPDDGHGDERVVFPVWTIDKELVGFTGRAIDNEVVPRIRDYHGLNKRLNLLGAEQLRDSTTTPITVVEGLFDYAWVRNCGFPAVAAMHAGLTTAQRDILLDAGRPVILMYDRDEAGQRGAKKAKELLKDYLPVMKVKYPDNGKDPADCSAARIQWMIVNTRLA